MDLIKTGIQGAFLLSATKVVAGALEKREGNNREHRDSDNDDSRYFDSLTYHLPSKAKQKNFEKALARCKHPRQTFGVDLSE